MNRLKRDIAKRKKQKLSASSFRKAIGKLACIGAISLSCGIHETQRLRINPDAIITFLADDFSLVKGKSTPDELVSRMKSQGLTGITRDSTLLNDKLFAAVTADYQEKAHIFEAGQYSHSIRLNPGRSIPYDQGLRFGSYNDHTFLLAIYGDAIGLVKNGPAASPPRLEAFEYTDGRFEKHGRMSLQKVSCPNGGLRDPFFVGWSLDDGILFLARGDDGFVWGSAYHIRMEETGSGKIRPVITEPIPLRQALNCSCVQDYVYGE
jgi:hypothetical protein